MEKSMTAKWKTDECVVCGATENLTKDHVVPKWFTLGIKYFGFKMRKSNMHMDKKQYKYQTMCDKCNRGKSGMIDFTNPLVRAYVRQFIDNVNSVLEIYETNKPKN